MNADRVHDLLELSVKQDARVEEALRAGWRLHWDPARLEFTAARELHVARTLDELLEVIEAPGD